MDKERFTRALEEVMNSGAQQKGIGTLGEKSVHAVLKAYYSEDSECTEIKVGGFVADIVGENGITEIQTRSLWRLKKKLEAFLPVCRVNVVYPIEAVKYIQWASPETGELLKKRKSPKRCGIYDGIAELYGIKPLLGHENLSIRFMIIETQELRLKTGARRGRQKAKEKLDKIPTALLDEIVIEGRDDYLALLPSGLDGEFTSNEFAEAAKIRSETASVCLNVMRFVGAVEIVGKKGRLNLYRRACE